MGACAGPERHREKISALIAVTASHARSEARSEARSPPDLTLASLIYFARTQLRKRVRWLDQLNIPAAVVGGLLFTLLVLLLRNWSVTIQQDTAMQATLNVVFFTSNSMRALL